MIWRHRHVDRRLATVANRTRSGKSVVASIFTGNSETRARLTRVTRLSFSSLQREE
jgi:hypothetical protein